MITGNPVTEMLDTIQKGIDAAVKHAGHDGPETTFPAQWAGGEVWMILRKREPLAKLTEVIKDYKDRYGDEWESAISADIHDA